MLVYSLYVTDMRGTHYPESIEDTLFRNGDFPKVKRLAPMNTHFNPFDLTKRPMSSFSVRLDTQTTLGSTSSLGSAAMPENNKANNLMATLSPPPAFYEEPTSSKRSSPPRINSNRVSPVCDDDDIPPAMSPGDSELYHSQYITTPVPRAVSPHLPAPSPQPSPKPGFRPRSPKVSPYMNQDNIVKLPKMQPAKPNPKDFIY